jgi:hypothetical protein
MDFSGSERFLDTLIVRKRSFVAHTMSFFQFIAIYTAINDFCDVPHFPQNLCSHSFNCK